MGRPPASASVTDLGAVSGVRPATVATCTLGWKPNPVNATVFGPGRVMVTPVRSAMPTTGLPLAGVGLSTLKVHPGPGARHEVSPVFPGGAVPFSPVVGDGVVVGV